MQNTLDNQSIHNIQKYFGLDDDSSPEKLDTIFAFFEKKKFLNAYKTLFCHYFELHKITNQVLIETYLRKYVNINLLLSTLNRGVEDLIACFYTTEEKENFNVPELKVQKCIMVKNFFLKHGDKLIYKKLIIYMIDNLRFSGLLDQDIKRGLININVYPEDKRNKLFMKSNIKQFLLSVLDEEKKVKVIIYYLSQLKNQEEVPAAFKTIEKPVNELFKTFTERGQLNIALMIIRAINYEQFAKYIHKYFRESIAALIDKYEETGRVDYPLNQPMFMSCQPKNRNLAAFDYISAADANGQKVFRLDKKFGIMDTNDKILVKPIFDSIGLMNRDGVRMALRNTYGLFHIDKAGKITKQEN